MLPLLTFSMKSTPYFDTAFLFITNSPPINIAGISSLLPEPPVILPPEAKPKVGDGINELNKFFILALVISLEKSKAAFRSTSVKLPPFSIVSDMPSIRVSLNFSAPKTNASESLFILSNSVSENASENF